MCDYLFKLDIFVELIRYIIFIVIAVNLLYVPPLDADGVIATNINKCS